MTPAQIGIIVLLCFIGALILGSFIAIVIVSLVRDTSKTEVKEKLNIEKIRYDYLGEIYTLSIKTEISKTYNSISSIRVYSESSVITMDYSPSRLNIVYRDSDKAIINIYMG